DNEPGLGGVTIYVDQNSNGQLDDGEPATVSADDTGEYSFDDLAPGRYTVSEVVPDDYRQTFPWEIAIDPLPGFPIVPFVGRSHFVALEPGQQLHNLDFGNQPIEPGFIAGTKWHDVNGNSQRDDNEPGLSGVTIYLDLNFNGQLDENEPSAVTDESGSYTLTAPEPGTVSVREVVPDGYVQTFPPPIFWLEEPLFDPADDPIPVEPDWPIGGPVEIGPDGELVLWPIDPLPPFPFPDGQAHFVAVIPGETVSGIDFGNQELVPGSVSGTKWLDANGNSQRDEGEAGLAGVTVYADLNFNGMLDESEPSTVTDESGRYTLEGLDPGSAWIREVVPEGFMQTFPASFILFDPLPELDVEFPFPDIFAPPFPGEFPEAHYVNVLPGGNVDGIDFGNQKVEPPGTIQGVKWEDVNGDGVRQDDEPGIAGVTVFADLNLNGELDRGEPTAITHRDNPDTDFDEAGQYTLSTPAGSTLVMEIVPRGYQQIFPSPFRRIAHPYNLGHVVNVVSGGEVAEINFGNQRTEEPLGSISGTKWIDFNANGIREADERGDANVTIYLDLNGNGIFDRGEPSTLTQGDDPSTRADETGNYQFTGLAAGDYIVREDLPFGFAQSFPNNDIRFDSQTERLSKGLATAFTLSDVVATVSADGLLDVTLDFDVTWPNGCGSLIDEGTDVHFDGNMVHVLMTGAVFDGVCTQAFVTATQSFTVHDVKPGGYGVMAIFMEHLTDGDQIESFVLEGKFDTGGGDGSHRVRLADGQNIGGLDFGNFPVPIPPPIPFDANGDGTVDDADIDIVAGAMNGLEGGRGFDFTNDGVTDRDDIDHLVNEVLHSVYGDSNLDGVFDSSDLVKVFQAAEYEDGIDGNSTWAEGDWNGDGDFNTQDLVFVFQKAQYSRAVGAIDASIADRIWSVDKQNKKGREAFLA
ncbi:MAG: hypothetical protein KDB27_11960, partial [Planctomycetales bacterium]|nr:hypothetical protein [Planctomycetales bacterium]